MPVHLLTTGTDGSPDPVPLLTAEGFLLDMDGTLVDSTAVVHAVWGLFAQQHGLTDRLGEILTFSAGRPGIDTIRHFLPDVSEQDRREIQVALIAEEIARTDGNAEVPGARAFVTALLDDRVPVALVTSATEPLMRVRMEAAGVPVPGTVVCAEDVERGKPAPEGYLRAAGMLGLAPGCCVVFEDASSGYEAARAAGAQVVVVGDGVPEADADAVRVADLRGLTVRPVGQP